MFKTILLILPFYFMFVDCGQHIYGEVDNESVCGRIIREPVYEYYNYPYRCCTRVYVPCKNRFKRSSAYPGKFGYNCIEYRQNTCFEKRKRCTYKQKVEKYCCKGFQYDSGSCKPEATHECRDCQHACKISDGKVSCKCFPGYRLTDKYECININECKEKNPCGSNSKCKDTNGSFFCYCNSGYELKNATHCVDIDECKDTVDACQERCHNTPGGFHCFCGRGLKSNGSICLDIDECKLTNRGGCSHGCENTYGSYNCTCPIGMKLGSDNHTCQSNSSTHHPSFYSTTPLRSSTGSPHPSSVPSSSSLPPLGPNSGQQRESSKKKTDGVLAGIITACILGTVLIILLIIFFFKKGWCNCCTSVIGVAAASPKKLKATTENEYIEPVKCKKHDDKKQKEIDEEDNLENFYINGAFQMTDPPPNYKDVVNEIQKESAEKYIEKGKFDKEVENETEINKEEPIYGNLTNEAEAESVYVNVNNMA